MHISVVTLFPEMFEGPLSHSIIKRAIAQNFVSFSYISMRDFASDQYKSVDDHPYGGGHGMVLRVDIVDKAIEYAKQQHPEKKSHVILIDAQGTPYTQPKAMKLSTYDHLILVCGHYEGFDERVRHLVDEEISIGDYILTGGELPAMVVIDSLVRLIPGVLKKTEATAEESFAPDNPLLEHPQYTRPETYKNMSVPAPLLSGNHKDIQNWRKEQAALKTKTRRPDLLTK